MFDPIDDQEVVWVAVPLDAATAARLENLANACHAPDPRRIAASLLHDVLKDDEETHFLLNAPAATPAFN